MLYDFAVIGGDRRQVYVANGLRNRRYKVVTCGIKDEELDIGCPMVEDMKEAVKESKWVIGPIVFSRNDILEYLSEGQVLVGGCISKEVIEICKEKKVCVYDFMRMDDVAIYNAIATAEGAIVKAMELMPTNLHGSRCLVLGYGRCGKVLARKLKGLDAKISVCARSVVARSEADAAGFETMDFSCIERRIRCYDYIFNTVPAKVLTYDILKRVYKCGCIIDIASLPGGVEQEDVEELQVSYYHCPSLPGIYAPKSSGIRLAEKIIELKGSREGEA